MRLGIAVQQQHGLPGAARDIVDRRAAGFDAAAFEAGKKSHDRFLSMGRRGPRRRKRIRRPGRSRARSPIRRDRRSHCLMLAPVTTVVRRAPIALADDSRLTCAMLSGTSEKYAGRRHEKSQVAKRLRQALWNCHMRERDRLRRQLAPRSNEFGFSLRLSRRIQLLPRTPSSRLVSRRSPQARLHRGRGRAR